MFIQRKYPDRHDLRDPGTAELYRLQTLMGWNTSIRCDRSRRIEKILAEESTASSRVNTSSLIPAFHGAPFGHHQWKDVLWDQYFTGAPTRQRRCVEPIQQSQESLIIPARCHGITSPKRWPSGRGECLPMISPPAPRSPSPSHRRLRKKPSLSPSADIRCCHWMTVSTPCKPQPVPRRRFVRLRMKILV